MFENPEVWHCCLLKLVYVSLHCDFWTFIQGCVGLTCLGLGLRYVYGLLGLSKTRRTKYCLSLEAGSVVFELRLSHFAVGLVQCFLTDDVKQLQRWGAENHQPPRLARV